LGAALLLLLAVVFPAATQPFTINWYTVDGGGLLNATGGTMVLSGTAGQPDAGILDGGILDGGFWSLFGPIPPRLTITLIGANVQVCWPSPSTGFTLQQTSSLSTPVWTVVAQVPSDNGITKCVTLPHTGLATFYRLANP
jgi:hypothetical protein